MFQDFEDLAASAPSAERIARLRAEFKDRGLDGMLVPRTDEHQGEYVAPYAERLRWLTGFSGSAGLAIILADQAAIFVDGRYTIQVRQQTDARVIEPHHLMEEPPDKWLEKTLKPGQRLGYDPWLNTVEQIEKLGEACRKAGGELVALESNPLDAVWADRPAPPERPVEPHPPRYAGRSVAEKQAELAQALAKAGADAAVLSLTDSIAWAFNIRGHDLPHTPVALAFAILQRDGKSQLFLAPDRLTGDAAAQLQAVADVLPPDRFESALRDLGAHRAKVLLDPEWTPEHVRRVLADAGAEIVKGRDPCILPKARKNAVEQEGARQAHLRDGAAMCRFLCWFEREAASGGLDEIAAARRLEAFRRDTGLLADLSFASISAAGPHAAIPHYRVSERSNRPIGAGEIYLIDSGGQYRDGTTDITRTLVAGAPTGEMRDRFTRVLKGMIAISVARFPKGTLGVQLDTLARQTLWHAGLDYDHGTGHGVGSYLSVHEGPARLSKLGKVALEPGMILSDEPGYYKEGQYGIRIENLLLVREAEPVPGGERPMHAFETLTLCPIERRLIEPALLTAEEIAWLDAYHARVREALRPLLDAETGSWLVEAAAPL